MAWIRTYDIDTPDGSVDDPSEAADRMNEIKLATQERENVDHYWPLTGSEVSDLEAGEHRKVTIRTLSVVEVAALAGAKAYLYRLVTDGELYFKDASGNTIQLTSGGKILSASLDMLNEDDMASDSAVHAATQQSIKAYADAIAAAAAVYVDDHVGHDGDGYVLYDVDGVPTKVYTKYLTGNLDADSSTSVAHGVNAANIKHVSVACYDDNNICYNVVGYRESANTSETFRIRYDNTNIIIDVVGSYLQGNAYRIKIDYTV